MQFRVVAKSECQLAQSERQSTPKSSVYNTARQPHTNTYNSYPQIWAVYNKVSRETHTGTERTCKLHTERIQHDQYLK